MEKNLLITEKPSVAMEFAKVLKCAANRKNGYIESNDWIITWCVGHLVTMSYPEKYDESLKRWSLNTLPFLPKEYKYEVIPAVEKQFNVIKELKSEGKAIVYTSHRLKEIFEVCDYITVLRDGKYVGSEDLSNLDEDKMIEMMVGRKLTDQFPRVEIKPGKTILKVENLNNEYVSDINFEVKAGEVVGIAGLMGAGRSELAKTIYGHFKKQSGKIILNGKELNHKSAQEGLLNRIAYVSEDRKGDGLLVDLSVRENMTLSSLNKISKKFIIDKKYENERVDSYIERINIKTPNKEQLIKNLSGGNQQKVAIAKALMTHPEVLILDEPTRGVDVGAKKEIYDLINDFKSQGKAVIMISSEMPEILGLSDKILVLRQGRITKEFDIKDASQEAILKCAVETKEAV